MAAKREGKTLINEHQTKRGKRSKVWEIKGDQI